MENEFLKYGAWGAAVLGLSAFVLILINWLKKKDDDHTKVIDRITDEHRKMVEKIFDKNIQQTENTNEILRENTNILSGLKTLLENKNR